MSDAGSIAEALGGRSEGPGKWKCHCPAHDDATPSLGLEDKDGTPVWYCHAGCSQDAVTAALRARGLWSGAGAAKDDGLPPGILRVLKKEGQRLVTVWVYPSAAGEPLGYVGRYESPSAKEKSYRPYFKRTAGGRWKMGAADIPRPLYQLDCLAKRPDDSVLVTEGEKSADAAEKLFPDFVAVTSPGGAKSAAKADWRPLAGRRVVIWPDADAPGRAYARQVAALAREAGAVEVRIVHVPETFSEGWDLADTPPDGANLRDMLETAQLHQEEATKPSKPPQAATGEPEVERLLIWVPRGKGRFVVETNLANTTAILGNHSAWIGKLAFNEFEQRPVMTECLPSHIDEHVPAAFPTMLTDADTAQTTIWLQRSPWQINVGVGVVQQALAAVSRAKRLHPVREYLESLKWDGQPRIDTWLSTYLGAPDTPYARATGRRWLISAVARIFSPGCKADCVLVLEGRQGAKKSTALAVLAVRPEWFTDEIAELGSKDSEMQLLGVWIIEMAELSAVKRAADVERVKGFVSRRADRFRSPYGRTVETFDRQCVFAASTNESEYFADSTGNRRFWPVACGSIDVEAIERDRNQLWAEAVTEYRAGAPWWLEDPELEELAAEEQEERYAVDAWESEIADYISTFRRITTAHLLEHVFHVPKFEWSRPEQMRVGRILHRLGWKRKKVRVTDKDTEVVAGLPGWVAGTVWVYEPPARNVPTKVSHVPTTKPDGRNTQNPTESTVVPTFLPVPTNSAHAHSELVREAEWIARMKRSHDHVDVNIGNGRNSRNSRNNSDPTDAEESAAIIWERSL